MSGWTDERISQAKNLWFEGFSAGQIAKRIGGVTRNAVIGKVHRLGLSGRATPSDPKLREPYPARRASVKSAGSRPALVFGQGFSSEPKPPRVVKQSPPPAGMAPSLKVRLLDLTSAHCRFPTHEEAGQHLFCGGQRKEGSSYCDDHHRTCNSGFPKREKVMPDLRPARGRTVPRRTMEAA